MRKFPEICSVLWNKAQAAMSMPRPCQPAYAILLLIAELLFACEFALKWPEGTYQESTCNTWALNFILNVGIKKPRHAPRAVGNPQTSYQFLPCSSEQFKLFLSGCILHNMITVHGIHSDISEVKEMGVMMRNQKQEAQLPGRTTLKEIKNLKQETN